MKISALFFSLLLLLAASPLVLPVAAKAAITDNLSGYAWSSNVGWVSFNCSNDNSCATNNYGVKVAADGTISGYAWSPNIGWIDFGSTDAGFGACPSGTCQAMLGTGGTITGWARAVAGEVGGPATGGWDGWIHLNGSTYGVQASNCNWGGSAWGGGTDVNSGDIGWLKFSGTGYGVVGKTGSPACAPPAPLTASCAVAPASATTNQVVTWTPTVTGGTVPYSYQWSGIDGLPTTAASPSGYMAAGPYPAGQVKVTDAVGASVTSVVCAGSPITVSSCTVPGLTTSNLNINAGDPAPLNWSQAVAPACQVPSCTFSDSHVVSGVSGTYTVYPVAASNPYSVQCGAPANTSSIVTVTVNTIGASLDVNPKRVSGTSGTTVKLTWTSSTNAASCSTTRNGTTLAGAQFTTTTSAAGGVTDPTPITAQTTYKLTCYDNSTPTPHAATSQSVVNVVPGFTEF